MSRSLLLAAAAALALAVPLGSEARSAETHWNGRIAFQNTTGIGSMNPDGSGQWGVELNVGDTQPAWSPDGTQLAVVTHWGGNNGILVMQPDGSGARLVTTNGSDAAPAWSPDGSQLAFVSNGNQLLAVSADGSNRRVLYRVDNGWIGRPAWSPDGGWIAFPLQSWTANTMVIGELETSTGVEHTLIAGLSYAQSPAFSPDGRRIAFMSSGTLFVADADGTNPQPITGSGQQWDDQPAWSPDGSQIAFVRSNQVWVMNADGSNARQLTWSNGGSSWPAWQPLGPQPSNCTLWGTGANDLLVGSDRNDVLCGGGGADTIIGLGGNDILRGEEGDDYLAGGAGLDFLDGGPGSDTLDARDGGELDTASGGPGYDRAFIDGFDRMGGIERPKVDPNLATWRPATASAFEPTNPPIRAVDGIDDDWWNSGGWPSQWLEVDLGRPLSIGRVRLVTMEYPAGGSILLLGRSTTSGPFHLLHAFPGPMAAEQQVSFAPKRPWRNVRYVRLYVPAVNASVGWAAWHELGLYAPKAKVRTAR